MEPERELTRAHRGRSRGQPNLPVRLTSFIGREAEVADVESFLETERLVTLIGAGGCGKTRLAQELAAGRANGAWWVDLSAVAEGELVVGAIAASIEVKEVSGTPLLETVKQALEEGPVLLLLDNCEHLTEACARSADALLRACATLTILATSREPLGVEGEVAWRVPSLDPPTARKLFVERASLARPGFELDDENEDAVAEICRRLDGMPLAIELAASRMRMMTPDQISSGLDDRFRLLTSSARTTLPRHRTLRASVDWSYDLLSDDERIVLRRLAVFAGGFTLEAAESICAGDGLDREPVLDLVAGLVDRSLVQVVEGGRYRLLETIRRYALDRLIRSGEHDRVRDRHLEFFVAFAEGAARDMEASGLLDRLPSLDLEHDDLRAAFDRSVQSGRADHSLRLVGALWLFWQLRGHLTEGRRLCEIALEPDGADPRLRARALLCAGALESYHGDLGATSRFAEEALTIARRLKDDRLEGRALDTLGYASAFVDPPAAPALFEHSIELSERTGDAYVAADAHNGLGIARFLSGDLVGARLAFERGLSSSGENGNPSTSMIARGVLGYVDALQGRLDEAETHAHQALELARDLRDAVFTGQGLFTLGLVEALRGEHDGAAAHLDESVETLGEASPLMLTFAFVTRAFACWIRGDVAGSATEAASALSIARELGMLWPTAWSLAFRTNAAVRSDDLASAAEQIAEAGQVEASVGPRSDLTLDAQGRLARAEGDPRRAEASHHDALEAARASESVLLVPAQLEAIAGLAGLGGSHAEAARVFAAAEAARSALGLVRFAVDEPDHRTDLERTRAAMSGQEFRRAWDEGDAMSLEQALAYVSRGRGSRKRPSVGWAGLTPTEVEVVRHVAEGLTNPQIAERLFVSRSTVKVHLAHVFAKLGVSTRAELAALAAKRER